MSATSCLRVISLAMLAQLARLGTTKAKSADVIIACRFVH